MKKIFKILLWFLIILGVFGAVAVVGKLGRSEQSSEAVATNITSYAKVYASVDEMNAGAETDGVEDGAYVIISCDVNDVANAQVFCKADGAYTFVVDLSGSDGAAGQDGVDGQDGAQGPQGEKGDDGDRGLPGMPGSNGRELKRIVATLDFNDLYDYYPWDGYFESGGESLTTTIERFCEYVFLFAGVEVGESWQLYELEFYDSGEGQICVGNDDFEKLTVINACAEMDPGVPHHGFLDGYLVFETDYGYNDMYLVNGSSELSFSQKGSANEVYKFVLTYYV